MTSWARMRGHFRLMAASTLLAAAAPAGAPPAAPASPAATSGTPAVATPPRSLTVIGNELYLALLEERSPDVIAHLLREGLTHAGHDCEQLRDYQIFRYGSGSRTLKVKCINKPLYVVTVGSQKGVQISGGDGSIQPFTTLDGPIETVFGVRAEQYFNSRKAGATGAEPVTAAPAAPPAAHGDDVDIATGESDDLPSWAPIVGINLIILLVLGIALLRALRGRDNDEDDRYSSDEKDMMIEQAEEILPGIYRHPEGFFIARGRHGKRRLFRVLLLAYLYRQFGIKLLEMR